MAKYPSINTIIGVLGKRALNPSSYATAPVRGTDIFPANIIINNSRNFAKFLCISPVIDSREPPFFEITYNPTTGIKTADTQNPIDAKDH